MNQTQTKLERLHRTFAAVDNSVRNLESNPNSPAARRQLTSALKPFLLALPPEERATLAKALDRARNAPNVSRAARPTAPERARRASPALENSALARDVFEHRELLAQKGELLRSDQLQEILGVSRQAISQRVQNGSLFYVNGKGGARYYPAFFADPSLDLDDVKRVSKELTPLSGASKWVFFTSPLLPLYGLSPLDVIRGKRPPVDGPHACQDPEAVNLEAVLRAARAAVER